MSLFSVTFRNIEVSTTFQSLSLNIICVTYNGQFNIGFTGCRDNLPHLQRLAVYSSEALDALESAPEPPKRPVKRTRAAAKPIAKGPTS